MPPLFLFSPDGNHVECMNRIFPTLFFCIGRKKKKSVRMIRIEEKKVCFNRGVNMINSENSMDARSLFFSFFRLLFNISKALNLIFLFVSKNQIFLFFSGLKK